MAQKTEITPELITKLIDTVWDGVNRSKAGPVIQGSTLHHIGFNSYLHILSALCPRAVQMVESKLIVDDKPHWLKGDEDDPT